MSEQLSFEVAAPVVDAARARRIEHRRWADDAACERHRCAACGETRHHSAGSVAACVATLRARA